MPISVVNYKAGYAVIITSLFKTVVECYNSKAYVFYNGELEIDYDLEWEISETLNPLSAYWKNKNIF